MCKLFLATHDNNQGSLQDVSLMIDNWKNHMFYYL